MSQIKITIVVLAMLSGNLVSFAQNRIKVTIEILDLKKEGYQNSKIVKDSVAAEKQVSEELYRLYFEGFLGAMVAEKNWEENELRVKIFPGEQYLLRHLKPGNVDPLVLNTIGFRARKTRNVPFQYREIEKIFRRILDHAENSGYPFAVVRLDSLEIHANGISAALRVWSGPKIHFDTLITKGFSKLKPEWLAGFLGVQPGEPYSEKVFQNIGDKMKNLEFATLAGDPQVVFSKEKAKVILELGERKVNRIDGILGVLPNARDDSKLMITGNLNLHLYNLFMSAKQLHLDWQQVKPNSQTFHFQFLYPRFLKMPLGVNAGLDLLKEDTLFFNRTFNLQINFIPGRGQNIYFNSELGSSRLTGNLSNDPGKIPEYGDFDLNYYGITYQLNRLDDAVVPTSGFYFSAEGLAGKKTIIKDETLPDSVYRDVDLQPTQYKIRLQAERYFPLPKNFVSRVRLLSGNLIGNNLFINDLFRIGGLNTLRGFNENFFFVSDYALVNLEMRITGGGETYFFVFYDQAVLHNALSESTDYPLGSGLGMSVASRNGIFNFIFALGKSQSQNFSINSAKIHFGYTGKF